ncbi:MAG: pyrroline-5-carboxylate reductase [Elainella sp. Prado103]|nr:pyrroline-5-carboxylate reductase [Elainella sp. Prado103]
MSIQFGMIGGGVMGEALLSRLLAQQIYLAEQVIVSDPQLQRREFLQQQYGIQVTADNLTAATAPVLMLAIKPQMFDPVTAQLQGHTPIDQFVLSILAGVPLHRLEAAFPDQPVVRSMPNTPATVGAGMTAIAGGRYATPEHLQMAYRIFAAVGQVVEVAEPLLDAVTGLSGSGPGYVAVMIEALIDGGVAAGLPRPIATQLAIQTVRGTAELLQAQSLHPAQLKDQVTSPGGTTIAGIAQLEQAGFRSGLIEAVKAAYRRSQELGR